MLWQSTKLIYWTPQKNNIIAQHIRAVIAPVNEDQAGTLDLTNAPLTNDISDITKKGRKMLWA